MDRFERESLDRHLTGNYGEDSVQDGGEPDDELAVTVRDGLIDPGVLLEMADGIERRLEEDEDADRQYLLENVIQELRLIAKAARKESA